MARDATLKDCVKIPLVKAATEPTTGGNYQLITNRYWQVVDSCILLYRGFAPQCNSSKDICERLSGGIGQVKFLEKVWLHHECDR